MVTGSAATFLDLAVGRFRLALRADCVLGVLNDVSIDEPVHFRGATFRLVDLGALMVGEHRDRVPFAVAVETDAGRIAAGVDAVGHLNPGQAPKVRALPSFGLQTPELFDGVLTDERGLLLILRPSSIVRLTAVNERDI
jgi:hypothetical protein